VRAGTVVRVTSAPDAPVNGMALCVKGRYGYDYVHHADRLTRPLIRAKWLSNVEEQVASGRWQVTTVAHKRTGSQNGNGDSQIQNPKSKIQNPDTFIETDWDTALDVVAGKFAVVKQEHGGDALAVLASAKCTNEENYLFNKFARQVLGTNTIDHCARL
jgi:predicted molibdopterin-dependent oxidoreductase YjgC